MIFDKKTIEENLNMIKMERKLLKKHMAELYEEEALFQRLLRAIDNEATPEELEGLEMDVLRFFGKMFATIRSHKKEGPAPKHETNPQH